MEIKITRQDKDEAVVGLTGTIWIRYEQKSEFEAALEELIGEYAI